MDWWDESRFKDAPHIRGAQTLESVAPFVARMTRFIHDNGVGLVLVTGSSASMPSLMVREFWKRLYPEKKLPYFVTLTKFKQEPGKPRELQRIGPSLQSKDIATRVERGVPKELLQDKGKLTAFVLDEFAGTQGQLYINKVALTRMGVGKVLAGAVLARKFERIPGGNSADFVGAFVPLDCEDPIFWGKRRDEINAALANRKARNASPNSKFAWNSARNSLSTMRSTARNIARTHPL